MGIEAVEDLSGSSTLAAQEGGFIPPIKRFSREQKWISIV
jgi:hypothetical protein